MAAAEREKIFKKFRDPEEVFQLLNDAQSRSYFLTEHVQALEDEFEKEKKQREAQRAELEKLVKEGQENIQIKLALRKVINRAVRSIDLIEFLNRKSK